MTSLQYGGVFDSPPSSLQRDYNNPGCILLGSHYKFWYIDGRVGKAVKRFGEGASYAALPYTFHLCSLHVTDLFVYL